MTELDQLIQTAYESQGKKEDTSRVYLAFLRALLFVPVQKNKSTPEEPFSPLFAKVNDHYFMLAFDSKERLEQWGGSENEHIAHVVLSGRDIVAGIEPNVYLCLNVGCEFAKEFSPDEIKHLKMIVSRLDQL